MRASVPHAELDKPETPMGPVSSWVFGGQAQKKGVTGGKKTRVIFVDRELGVDG